MKNKILKVSFILFCVLISCVLAACKKETIKFYRESKVQELMQSFQGSTETKQQNGVVKKSSGIIIYKDTSTNANEKSSVQFGPRDVNFDLHIK